MKKIILVGAVLALALAPMAAGADDIYDGADCRAGTAEPVALGGAGGGDADRGSFCVHAGGTTVFYIGGEAQAEEDPGTGGACGAVIIMDQTVSGDDDWDNAQSGAHCD